MTQDKRIFFLSGDKRPVIYTGHKQTDRQTKRSRQTKGDKERTRSSTYDQLSATKVDKERTRSSTYDQLSATKVDKERTRSSTYDQLSATKEGCSEKKCWEAEGRRDGEQM